MTNFSGVGGEMKHEPPFRLGADEPPVLPGEDKSPNPVEHLLHSLAACLTTSMICQAAMRGKNR